MHDYDEAVSEVPRGFGSVAEAERLMLDLPAIYADLPLGAHGWRGKTGGHEAAGRSRRTTMSDHQEVGRVAFRTEGNNWTAYWALPDTLGDAVFLGAISMALAQNFARKDAFQALILDGVTDLMEELCGERPNMITRPAPESERSGNC